MSKRGSIIRVESMVQQLWEAEGKTELEPGQKPVRNSLLAAVRAV